VARTCTHLHFTGNAEAAFNFYKAAFGAEFVGPIERLGDLPPQPDQPELSAEEKNQVSCVKLPIAGGHKLVGNDTPSWMGPVLRGNIVEIGIELDTCAEAERIFAALSDGGTIELPFQEVGEGEYFGTLVDKFGTQWMVSCPAQP
jgi:PhnB protein